MTHRTVACLMAAALSAGLTGVPARAQEATTKPGVALIEISGSPASKPGGLRELLGEDAEPTLRDLVSAIDKAGKNPAFRGIVLRLKDAELERTQVEELGQACDRARAAGKKVHLFGEGFSTVELLLGAHADEVLAQRGSGVELAGVYSEEMFLADTLAWAGVKADMIQIGAYKGANEQMTRSAPSPEWEENISGLLDRLFAVTRDGLMAGRHLTSAQLDGAMERAWMSDADEAKELKLIDGVIDLPDLGAHLQEVYGAPVDWSEDLAVPHHAHGPDMSNPFGMLEKLLGGHERAGPTGPAIAVLHIEGVIVDGDSKSGGLFGGDGNVGSRTIRKALESIADEANIKGVVVRIDSPGGSATASEVIWQGLRRVAKVKPVWVSVGGMAASGGYYCAVGGDKVYINPSSIVGSIGVVGGRMSLAGLYEKLKVHVVSRQRGPRASMFRSTEPWTPQEQEIVRGRMQRTYDLFVSRVTAGRAGIEIASTGAGRLFAGADAVGRKMADKLGGFADCTEDLASSLGLTSGSYELIDYPEPPTLAESIGDMLGGLAQAGSEGPQRADISAAFSPALARTAAAALGPDAWREVRRAAEGLMILREERVLLMSPRVITFR